MLDPEGLWSEVGEDNIIAIDHRNHGIPLSAAGDYQCVACNGVGTSSVTFTIEIQGRMIIYLLTTCNTCV